MAKSISSSTSINPFLLEKLDFSFFTVNIPSFLLGKVVVSWQRHHQMTENNPKEKSKMAITTNADIQCCSYGYWKPGKNSSTFVPLGNAVTIDHITDNIETKDARLLLRFEYMGERRHVTINRSDFGDHKLVQTLAGKGADVTKKYFDYFVDTLRIQEDNMLQSGKRVEKVFSHLGWISIPVLNGEGQPIGRKHCYRAATLLGGYPATYTGPYSVTPRGNFDAWKNMVRTEVIGKTPLEIVLLAGLAAVVNGLIGPITTGENPIFHVCGCSSSGKSTGLSVCASVSGAPYDGEKRSYDANGELVVKRSIYGNWSATASATTRQCVGNQGAVIVLNELGKFREKDLTQVVYDLSDGVEKARLNSNMEVTTAENYNTVIVSSGEISLLEHCRSKTEGLHNRVLEITDPLTVDADHSRRIKNICRRHNGHAAPALAQYIIDNGGAKMVLPIYQGYCQSLLGQLPNHPTTPRFVEKFPALLMTTAELATKALGIQFDLPGILQFFVDHETNNGAQRSVAKNSYQVILDACRINKTSFYRNGEDDPKNQSYGRITYPNTILPDGQCVIEQYEIRRSYLEKILASNNFPNITTCAREWKSMGVLDHETGRLTRSRKIDKNAAGPEDVFVFRVFGAAPPAPINQPKSKLVKRSFANPSPQLAAILEDTDEEDDDND